MGDNQETPMTDPQPLTDDELVALKENTEGGIDPVRSQVLRLVATNA